MFGHTYLRRGKWLEPFDDRHSRSVVMLKMNKVAHPPWTNAILLRTQICEKGAGGGGGGGGGLK